MPVDPASPAAAEPVQCAELVELEPDVFGRCGQPAKYSRGGFHRCGPCDTAHARTLAMVSSGRPLPRERI